MSVTFQTVKPGARLADQVAATLETEIRSGRLAEGEKLPTEQSLVQQFGVSRTVVREAISRLRSLGLVDARQGSGMFVIKPDVEPLKFDPQTTASIEAVLQIVEVRRALEAEVAELAAQRRKASDVKATAVRCRPSTRRWLPGATAWRRMWLFTAPSRRRRATRS
jgi:GntR family transcriptional repressor for pyruvate dehydrogenase complex